MKKVKFPNYENFININEAFSNLIQKLTSVIDEIAPCKTERVKRNSKEWFDSVVSEGINNRDKLFKKFKKSRLPLDQEDYKKTRYEVKKLIAEKKRNYFETTLTENISKPKELKNTLKALGFPNKVSIATINTLKDDKVVKYDPKSISKVFQTFFTNMAKTLLQKLPPPPNKFGIVSVKSFYKRLNITTKLKPATEYIVLNLLKNIDISKAAGVDNLPGRFLKDGAVIFTKPVTEICNLSIKLKNFPDPWKLAKLKPIFKKGSRIDPSNYIPISLLPLISKIFEKIVFDQMIDYRAQYNILCKYQSGFRTKHSTDLSLSYLNGKILKGFDSGVLTGMILMDLQKPFDTIDHNILLEKLKAIGFYGDTVNWFHPDLADRAFLVSIENKYSSISKISCGVPQGSILALCFF